MPAKKEEEGNLEERNTVIVQKYQCVQKKIKERQQDKLKDNKKVLWSVYFFSWTWEASLGLKIML